MVTFNDEILSPLLSPLQNVMVWKNGVRTYRKVCICVVYPFKFNNYENNGKYKYKNECEYVTGTADPYRASPDRSLPAASLC